MQRKIFIAINLDEKTKNYLDEKLSALRNRLETKWTPRENLHITISYIGFIDDQRLMEIVDALNKRLSDFDPFDLKFDRLAWGPNPEKKKMIWAQGTENGNFDRIKGAVESAVGVKILKGVSAKPHITCARLKKREIEAIEEDDFLAKERLNFIVPINSVDVMESVYTQGKRVYRNLEIIELS